MSSDCSQVFEASLQDGAFVISYLAHPSCCRNVENNLFWGPVPEKLFGIPNFRLDLLVNTLFLSLM